MRSVSTFLFRFRGLLQFHHLKKIVFFNNLHKYTLKYTCKQNKYTFKHINKHTLKHTNKYRRKHTNKYTLKYNDIGHFLKKKSFFNNLHILQFVIKNYPFDC